MHTACLAGELRCLTCGKALADRRKLAQHLKDAHGGVNSPPPQQPAAAAARQPVGRAGASTAFSLGDLLVGKPQRGAAPPRTAAAPPQRDAEPKARGVQGTLKVRCLAVCDHSARFNVAVRMVRTRLHKLSLLGIKAMIRPLHGAASPQRWRTVLPCPRPSSMSSLICCQFLAVTTCG